MPITQYLERNARDYADEVCLVEINPEIQEKRRVTWRDYELIESNPYCDYRREITWAVFDEKGNRFANLLISRGIKKGDKVGILLMNCLEWLPIYFGILKTGALAVPLNFRYDSEEIKYCLKLADVDILVFGPQFIGRIEEIADEIEKNRPIEYQSNPLVEISAFLKQRNLEHLTETLISFGYSKVEHFKAMFPEEVEYLGLEEKDVQPFKQLLEDAKADLTLFEPQIAPRKMSKTSTPSS